MQAYLDLMRKIMNEGRDSSYCGTDSDARILFGAQLHFDLQKGFPLITTRRVNFKKIVAELLWSLKGNTNVEFLHQYGITKWDNWCDSQGNVGPVYGEQWRRWESSDNRRIDQLHNLISQIKFNPNSRRLILSSWNVACVDQMWVPPSNVMLQFHVLNNCLSCQLIQRTSDLFERVPVAIATYSLLTHIVAKECGLGVGEFVWVGGDVHVYHDNFDQINALIERTPRALPQLKILRDVGFLDQYEVDDIVLEGYEPYDDDGFVKPLEL